MRALAERAMELSATELFIAALVAIPALAVVGIGLGFCLGALQALAARTARSGAKKPGDRG